MDNLSKAGTILNEKIIISQKKFKEIYYELKDLKSTFHTSFVIFCYRFKLVDEMKINNEIENIILMDTRNIDEIDKLIDELTIDEIINIGFILMNDNIIQRLCYKDQNTMDRLPFLIPNENIPFFGEFWFQLRIIASRNHINKIKLYSDEKLEDKIYQCHINDETGKISPVAIHYTSHSTDIYNYARGIKAKTIPKGLFLYPFFDEYKSYNNLLEFYVKTLIKGINNSDGLQTDLIVYRGIGSRKGKEYDTLIQLKRNEKNRFGAFSTSYSMNSSLHFAGETCCLMEIRLRPKTKCLYVSGLSEWGSGEKEILLNPKLWLYFIDKFPIRTMKKDMMLYRFDTISLD